MGFGRVWIIALLIGATFAGCGEAQSDTPRAALEVQRAKLQGAIAENPQAIAERDWEALLSAARTLLADCDCASHCARCCESTTCTSTPHNTHLDRHRTVALLDALLVPQAPRKVA